MAFKVGDIVVLKSGGPKMTVCVVPNEYFSKYICEWFDDSGELKRSPFPENAIQPISDRINI
jgi:uncharacterized protein YodC (DUF2158 family)